MLLLIYYLVHVVYRDDINRSRVEIRGIAEKCERRQRQDLFVQRDAFILSMFGVFKKYFIINYFEHAAKGLYKNPKIVYDICQIVDGTHR